MSACFLCKFFYRLRILKSDEDPHPDASHRNRRAHPEHSPSPGVASAEPTVPAFLDIDPGTPERVTLALRALLPPPVASEKSRDHQTPQPEGGLSPWGGLCGPRGWGGVALFIFVRDPCEEESASPITPPGRRCQRAWRPAPRDRPGPCRPALLPGEQGHANLLSEHHGEHTLPHAPRRGFC